MSAATVQGRIVWHELATPDPEGAKAFYPKVVGWTTKDEAFGENSYTTWQGNGVAVGGLFPQPAGAIAAKEPPAWLIYFGVADCDAAVTKAKSLGGSVVVEAQDIPTIGRFAVLRDPQGVVFAILAPEPADTPEEGPKNLEFSWQELATSDGDGAVRFYTAMFGWVKQGEFDMGPEMGKYWEFGRDRFMYGGIYKARDGQPQAWLSYVQVPSADEAVKKAEAAGATVIVPPMDVPGGDRVAIMTDPQGAAFGVHAKKAG